MNNLTNTTTSTKKLTVLSMLTALSYISVLLIRIPVFQFLSYEPKDIIIAIGGFILGPIAALLISLVVSLIEMITISSTGFIGFVMNFLGSCAFGCTAAIIYKKKHTISGAILGLALGTIFMCLVMILWNYLITPLYMSMPRSEIVKMLIPIFLPFNLIKGGLNAAITMILYKPISRIFKKTNLIPHESEKKASVNFAMILISGLIIITCILFILMIKGTI